MFFFTVRYFCEDEPRSGPHTESGILHANTYGQAADMVVEFYGEKNIISFDALYRAEDIVTEEELMDMFGE